MSKVAGAARPLHAVPEATHHPGRRLGLLLEGLPGSGRSCLGLVDPLCGQEQAAELRKEAGLTESQGSVPPAQWRPARMPRRRRLGLGQNVRAPWASGAHTELLLTAVPMQVDPQLPPDVILHARVLLIMQPVQGAAHHCVHLRPRTRGKKTTGSDARGKPGAGGRRHSPHTDLLPVAHLSLGKTRNIESWGMDSP